MKGNKKNIKFGFKTNLLVSFSTLLLVYLLIAGVFSTIIFQSDIKEIERSFGQSFLGNSLILEETIKSSHEEGFNVLINKEIAHILYSDIEELSSGREELLKVTKKIQGLKTSLPSTISNLFIYSGDGTVFTISGVDEFPVYLTKFVVYDNYDSEFWKDLKSEIRNFEILDMTIENVNGKRTQVIPVAISYGSRQHKSLLVICISADAIISNFKESTVFEQETIICTDENNNEIFYIGEESKHSVILNDITSSDSSILQKDKTINSLKYRIVSIVDDYGYKYSYYVPTNAILKEAIKNNVKVVVLFIGVFAVGLFLTFILSLRLYKPIKEIMEVIKDNDDFYPSIDNDSKELEIINTILSNISSNNKNIKKQYNNIKSKYIDKLFLEIIERHDMEADNETYFRDEIKFTEEHYTCALLDIKINNNFFAETSSAGELFMLDKMANILSSIMSGIVKVYYIEIRKFNYVFIFNTSVNERDKIIKALNSVLKIFELDKENGSIRIGLGDSYNSINQIRKSYFDAETVLLYNSKNNCIFDSTDIMIQQDYIFSVDERTSLVNLLKAGNYSDLKYKVEDIVSNNLSSYVSSMGLRQLVYEFYNIGYRDLYRKGINIEGLISKETNHKLSFILEGMNKVSYTSVELILYLYKQICDKSDRLHDNRKELIVNEVIDYIDKNYKKSDLYLEIISDVVGLSPKYISKVFKEVKAVSIIDYLSHYRINEAKKLLKDGMKIEDVAKEVGLENRTTFFRTFKKIEGISPAHYKKVYSEKQ